MAGADRAKEERGRSEAKVFPPIHVPYSAWLPAPLFTPCLFTWRISAKLRGEGFAQPVVPGKGQEKVGVIGNTGVQLLSGLKMGDSSLYPLIVFIHHKAVFYYCCIHMWREEALLPSFPLPTNPLPSSPACVSCRNA